MVAMSFDVWGLFDGLAGRGDGLQGVKARTATVLDAALSRVQAGSRLSDADLKRCGQAFSDLFEAMADAHGTHANLEFPPEDQTDFYIEAVKLTAIGHPNHAGWPVFADIRGPILPVLRARLAKQATPWLACCTVQPALVAGELALAQDCCQRIAEIPLFVRLVRRWCDEGLMMNPKANRAEVTRELAAGLPAQQDPWNAPTTSVPPDRRWILLASAYPCLSYDPRTTLAAPMSVSSQRISLENDWGIHDAQTAVGMLKWLLEEGHSAALCMYLDGRRRPMPAAAFEYLEGRRPVPVVEDKRAALERYRIRAWDLGRLIATARSAHAAGYLDETAAWEWLLAAGNAIRQTYTSWKDFGEDYILGGEFFEELNHSSHDSHVAMMRWFMDDPRSPWQRIAFGGPTVVPNSM
jgi:hypothetical protein